MSQTDAEARSIGEAVELLRRGEVVAFPTETVYGLGADARQARAVREVFAIKGRPATNPLICHVADMESARRYATSWPEEARRLAMRFWPGALTIVLPKHPAIVAEATAGLETVGLRVPDHPLALALLRAFDGPVAAPSANPSNRISPTTAEHVRQQLGERVKLILDGGACRVGLESTVLDLSGERPRLLRPGGISREQIEAEIGPIEWSVKGDADGPQRSPGQMPVHYAPLTPTYRFEHDLREQVLAQAQSHDAVVLLSPAEETPGTEAAVHWMSDDPGRYAQQLYAMLMKLDRLGPHAIYIEMPPDQPRWLAVRDRLMRAGRDWQRR